MTTEQKKYDEDIRPDEGAAGRDDLPGVFLVGDSIRMGYSPYAKEALAGVADVRDPSENCRFTQYTYIMLSAWRGIFPDAERVKVIVWNNGHWDVGHWAEDIRSLNSESVYAEMLVRIHHRLKEYFPGATIVFQTTCPPNPNGVHWANYRSRDEVRRYNEIAVKTLSPLGVVIDDLFSLVEGKKEEDYVDFCHFTEEVFKEIGFHTADVVRALLSASPGAR